VQVVQVEVEACRQSRSEREGVGGRRGWGWGEERRSGVTVARANAGTCEGNGGMG